MWQPAVGITRYRRIWLEDGILKATDAYSVLWPFNKPDLPTEFAKVSDAKSAIKFELRYAPLGYDSLVKDLNKRKGGDPLQWVCEHARFVRDALELIYDIAAKDGEDATGILHSLGTVKTLIYPRGAHHGSSTMRLPESTKDALNIAAVTITILVKGNTENMRQELMAGHNAALSSILSFNALIEAIWSMIGDLALKAQRGQEDGYFKKCEWCSMPFLASDRRQRFCPGPTWSTRESKQSLCGLKFRQHKLQIKKKGR